MIFFGCSLLSLSSAHVKKHTTKKTSGHAGKQKPFRIHIWPSLRNMFLSGRHGLEVKTSGQARRSQWRTCSVDSQRNSGNQFTILEQLTLLVALYIHDTVFQNGELMSRTWSRNIATKNIPPLVTDQSSDQFPSQQQRKNVNKGRKKKGLREMGAQWINVQTGFFGAKQTTT